MSTDTEDDEDFATILRRNTYSRFSTRAESVEPEPVPLKRNNSALDLSTKLNPKAYNTLNSFNDMGHLSRRVFNDCGENHLTSEDFANSFGFRKVFENKLEVTAITATTIATCMSSILHELIVTGEKMVEEGHFNGPQYDTFCGGGKNFRSRPQLMKSPDASFDNSQIQHCSSSHSATTPSRLSRKVVPLQKVDPIPTVQQITNFVAKLCNETQMEYECIIISLIYVRRLIKKSNGQLALLKDNWKGIVLACIVVSNKVWDDFHMQNLDYCYVFNGLTLERINSLELLLLLSIDNRCNVSPSMYAQTHFEIQAMITLTNIEKGKPRRGLRDTFSSKFAKVKPETSPQVEKDFSEAIVHSGSVEHPSPYKSFDFDDMERKTAVEDEARSDDSTGLSVDEYVTFDNSFKVSNIPAPVFAESDNPEDELPNGRKKVIHSADLENQRRNLRVLIRYDEESLIKSPVKSASGITNPSQATGSQASINSRTNSFKLSKQHSRKSIRGNNAFQSPMTPINSSKTLMTGCSFFSFGLCRGKVQDVI